MRTAGLQPTAPTSKSSLLLHGTFWGDNTWKQHLWYPPRSCSPSSAVLHSSLFCATPGLASAPPLPELLILLWPHTHTHTHTELLTKSPARSFLEQHSHLPTDHIAHSTLNTSSTQLLSSASVTSTVPADKSSSAISETKRRKISTSTYRGVSNKMSAPRRPAPKSLQIILLLTLREGKAWEKISPR